jgi:prevent-host-death family protein
MASWQAANAKAKFSELLDTAEAEGPQLVRRRKQVFVVTTEAEIKKRIDEAKAGKRDKFISAWEAMRPSKGALLNEEEFEQFSASLQDLRK